ncbi:hypothetical protein P3H15_17270 [Rhodococcus sp. T2V]|uniref:hypothetical protein n=1 Tax=Rhodococcus sp. T2V TaxID=3034164 RepID=UPI0023E18A68|nr:hypothetical protein [Rhodococcus sp. T2V]MDF3306776.1 hypothetical protein [Rhodococcus sp. T2V]
MALWHLAADAPKPDFLMPHLRVVSVVVGLVFVGSAANAVADIPAAFGPVFTDSVVAAVRSDMTFIAMMSHPLQTQTAPALWTSLKMDSPSSRTSRGRSSQTSPHGMGSGIALILLGGISLFQAWRTCSMQQRISRTNPRKHLMLIFFPNDRCDLAQAATVHPVCRPHPTRRGRDRIARVAAAIAIPFLTGTPMGGCR